MQPAIHKATGGTPEAGRAFVRRHQRRVDGLALSIVGDPAAAEEVAQEALLRAWRDLGSSDAQRGPRSTTVLSLTRKLALETRRRRGGGRPGREAVRVDDAAHGSVRVGPAAGAMQSIEAEPALSRLPIEQRRALVLATFHGYTAQEISEVEAIPLAAAKARLRSGLLSVRSQLGDDVTSVRRHDGAPGPRGVAALAFQSINQL